MLLYKMPIFNSLNGSEHVKYLLRNTSYDYLEHRVGACHCFSRVLYHYSQANVKNYIK